MKVKTAQNGEIVKNKELIHIYTKDIFKFKNISKKVFYTNIAEYDTHFSYFVDKDLKIQKLIDVLNSLEELRKEIDILSKLKKYNLKNIDYFINNSELIKNFIFNNSNKIFSDGNASIKIDNEILNKINSNYATVYKNEIKEYKLIKTGNG